VNREKIIRWETKSVRAHFTPRRFYLPTDFLFFRFAKFEPDPKSPI